MGILSAASETATEFWQNLGFADVSDPIFLFMVSLSQMRRSACFDFKLMDDFLAFVDVPFAECVWCIVNCS